MSRIAKPPKVKVVFDTNILFTDLDAKLIASGVDRTIKSAKAETGLEIEWILPEVVVRERFRQMHSRACKLLEPVRKLEKLIGHNLALSDEILADRVKAVIEREKTDMGLLEQHLDYSRVDWEKIAYAATARVAPFADDQSEKGFKDALILETFIQVVQDSPKSPISCRVFLVSSDGLLHDAAVAYTRTMPNASVYRSMDELRTQLTAIASHLSDEDLERILPEASDLFFREDDEERTSIYYAKGVEEAIRKLPQYQYYPNDLSFSVSEQATTIFEPSFVEKQKQTLFFRTEIVVTLTAFRRTWQPRPTPPAWADRTAPGLFGLGTNIETGLGGPAKVQNALAYVASDENYITETDTGELEVSAHWQATLTAIGKLSRPEIISVEPIACVWNSQKPTT